MQIKDTKQLRLDTAAAIRATIHEPCGTARGSQSCAADDTQVAALAAATELHQGYCLMFRWPLHSSHTSGDVQVQQAGPPRTDTASSSTSEQYNIALRERIQFIREQQDASTALGKVLVMRNKAAVLFDPTCAPHGQHPCFAPLQI